MSYQIESTSSFDRAVKRLAKKYHHIKQDLRGLVDALLENPLAGDAIPGFAHAVWKIRLASSDMHSGKRGGYRVIYAVNQETEVCYTDRKSVECIHVEAGVCQPSGTKSKLVVNREASWSRY